MGNLTGWMFVSKTKTCFVMMIMDALLNTFDGWWFILMNEKKSMVVSMV